MKTLHGDHLARAIGMLFSDQALVHRSRWLSLRLFYGPFRNRANLLGRIAGEGGKVKFSIENASRTRIVLADT